MKLGALFGKSVTAEATLDLGVTSPNFTQWGKKGEQILKSQIFSSPTKRVKLLQPTEWMCTPTK